MTIIGGRISPHVAMVRTTATCLFSQTDVLTVTILEPFLAKDLLGIISKKTGVSPMLPTSAEEFFLIFQNLAFPIVKTRQLVSNRIESFSVIELRLG